MAVFFNGVNMNDVVATIQQHAGILNQLLSRVDVLEKRETSPPIEKTVESKSLAYLDAARLIFDSEFCVTDDEKKSLQSIITRIKK